MTENEVKARRLEYSEPTSNSGWKGSSIEALDRLISSTSSSNAEYGNSTQDSGGDMSSGSNIRNIRNNNLGNIKKNSNNNWQGQVDSGEDKTFVTFKTPELGVRALKKVIQANINATNNIEEYVNRYASEPKEKEYYAKNGKLMPHLQKYANLISSSQGLKSTKQMPSNINMKKWIKATAIAEGGGKALKYFTDDIIEKGMSL
jgi:hypothetical protein